MTQKYVISDEVYIAAVKATSDYMRNALSASQQWPNPKEAAEGALELFLAQAPKNHLKDLEPIGE